MGSKSDLELPRKLQMVVKGSGIETVLRLARAHKSVDAYILRILREYEADTRPKVYITVAGRSNALSGFTDGSCHARR